MLLGCRRRPPPPPPPRPRPRSVWQRASSTLFFSITRTRTTTRTRNYLPGTLGIRHLCLCTQTAPQGPLFPSAVSEKA
jgi:hypothetical protein